MTAGGELPGFLSILQLSDSGFPSGRYTLSHGLEGFAQAGGPYAPAALLELLGDLLRFGVAPSDGAALACGHRAVDGGRLDIDLASGADRRLTAVKLIKEQREASARTGRALLTTAAASFEIEQLDGYVELVEAGRSPGNYAVVLGLLTGGLGVPRLQAVSAELYSFCAGWTGAGVRLGLIDHRLAQRLLHLVRSTVVDAALAAVDRDVDDISSRGPLPDVIAMRHEQADLRLFAT
jgi:urease accessory protein